eukprot:SAG11_NODE_14809_length_599_cov_0.618000_2_plen_72_part_01
MEGGLYASQYFVPSSGGSYISIQGNLLDEGNDPRCTIGDYVGRVPVLVERRLMVCEAPPNAELGSLGVTISL